MVLTEMVELFLASRKRGMDGARKECSPKTLVIYSANLKAFLNHLQTEVKEGGVTRYSAVRKMHVVQFCDCLDAKVSEGVWALSSKYQVLRTLRVFFRWVDKDPDLVDSNGDRLRGRQNWLPTIPKNPRRLDIPAHTTIKRFKNTLDTANRWAYRDFVVLNLMDTNGMRAGEVCNLMVRNILWDEKILYVTGKKGDRAVPVTSEMLRLLKGWLKRRETCEQAKDSPYVFITKRSPQMDVSAFGQRLRKHREKHELPRVTAHTFRHSFCTEYLKGGGDIAKLQNITGHTTVQQLIEYTHLAKLGSKAAQDELEKINSKRDL